MNSVTISFRYISFIFFLGYTQLESGNSSFTYSPSSAWQTTSTSGSSYWTNPGANASSESPNSIVPNTSPNRSPNSPNYNNSSPIAAAGSTYHHLTPQSQFNSNTDIYQSSPSGPGSPSQLYSSSSQLPPPVMPVPQSHMYYPTPALSPSHQLYPSSFSNIGYTTGWHGTGDYGIFQSSYHYQPGEYVSVIGGESK